MVEDQWLLVRLLQGRSYVEQPPSAEYTQSTITTHWSPDGQPVTVNSAVASDDAVSGLAWVWINDEMYDVTRKALPMDEQARLWAEIDLPLLIVGGDDDLPEARV
jgi:pimeloyl-ACP methyl ester carboxylesterase